MCRCTIQEIQSPLGSLHRLRVANSIPSIFHRRPRPPPPLRPGGRPGAPLCHETLRAFSTAAAAQALVHAGVTAHRARTSRDCRPRSHHIRLTCSRTGRPGVRLAAGPSRRQRRRLPAASRGSARHHRDREITLTADRLCLCLCLCI